MTYLNAALKEWAVAIDALLAGETILLLRKGGIREMGGQFRVTHDQVLLYPTYEHQRSHLLKSGKQPEPAPAQVNLKAWVQITNVLQVSAAVQLQRLLPFHIWTEQFATERLQWKPQQPLSVLLLRVYTLPQAIPLTQLERGCRSWIELDPPIKVSEVRPVLSQAVYERRSQQVIAALQATALP
jgi:hypothetical protein